MINMTDYNTYADPISASCVTSTRYHEEDRKIN